MARIAIIAEDADAEKEALEVIVPTLEAIRAERVDAVDCPMHQIAVCSRDDGPERIEALVQEACQQDGVSLFIGVGVIGLVIPEALNACTGTAKPVIYVPMHQSEIRHTNPDVLTTLPSVGGLQAAAVAACRILATGHHDDLELALLQWLSKRGK